MLNIIKLITRLLRKHTGIVVPMAMECAKVNHLAKVTMFPRSSSYVLIGILVSPLESFISRQSIHNRKLFPLTLASILCQDPSKI